MKELPYFKFTLQEWQNGDITTMSDSCQGVFINVCVFYWASDCDVTEERLFKRFRASSKTVQKLIKSEVIKCQNSVISISFLDQQFLELIKTKQFFSDMGKLGQKAKNKEAPLKPPITPSLSYNIKEDKIKDVVSYLNETVGTKYRYTTTSTVSHINARFEDGYSVDDFKKVIEKKYTEWRDTEHAKYLRPETLFGTKFEGYLNQIIGKTDEPKGVTF